MHRCSSRDVHVQFARRQSCTGTSSHASLRSASSLFLPLKSSCDKKGFPFQRGSRNPWAHKAGNWYNWPKMGRSVWQEEVPYSNYAGRDGVLYCLRAQNDVASNLLSWIVITCFLLHCDMSLVSHLSQDLSLFCSCSIPFACKLVA